MTPLEQEPAPRQGAARGGAWGLAVIVGQLLFGMATLALFVICQFWWSLGMSWGPGVSGGLALAAFLLNVAVLRRRVSAIDPLVWIPVSFLMFEFGMVFSIEVLGFDPGGLGYDRWAFGISRSQGRGFCTALLTMVAFMFGTYLAGVRDLSKGPDPTLPRDHSFAPAALVFTLGSLAMTFFGIILVGPATVFGTYGDWWAAKGAGVDQRFLDVGVTFSEAGIFALIASAAPRQRILRAFAYATALLIACITILKGDRSALITLGLGAGWCYSQSVRRIPWAPTLAVAVFVLALMPVIGEWRAWRSVEETSHASFKDLVGSAATSMGEQANAFVYTLDLVPSVKGYAWGLTYLAGVVNAIPNPLPTKGANPLRFTSIESSPSEWMTSIVAPEWWEAGGGYGYAMGAEWYYNFGMPGVLLGSMLFGWITGRMRNAVTGSALQLVASALIFGAMSVLVRNTFGYPFTMVTWPLIGLSVIGLAMRGLRPVPRRTLSDRSELARDALPDQSGRTHV
jgi:oligosaccharide repeat unit polymerase